MSSLRRLVAFGMAVLLVVGAGVVIWLVIDSSPPIDERVWVLLAALVVACVAAGLGYRNVRRPTRFVAIGSASVVSVCVGFSTFMVAASLFDPSAWPQVSALVVIAVAVTGTVAVWAYRLDRPPTSTAEGLFTAGTGVMPPYFAGRKRERLLLSRFLSDLELGKAPPSDVILMGPRGCGKTVLLLWFADECRRSRVNVVHVAAPGDLETAQELRNALLPAGRFGRLRSASLSWLGVKIELGPSQSEKERFMDRLVARCRRKPMVVLVDEAHTLNRDVGQYLLNLSQYVRKAPFLLVLAGTPGLSAHLRKMDASFWDRSRQFGLGPLSHTAAKEALEKPLSNRGKSIDVDALDSVANHSQCYAYFVQIWGEELWDLCLYAETQLAQLTVASVADVQDEVEKRMTDYYRHRYQELERGGLLQAARAIARIFQGSIDATATDHDIDDALATAYGTKRSRLDAREKLNELGYIWCPPGQKQVVWYAGIPSLMQHVLDAASAQ